MLGQNKLLPSLQEGTLFTFLITTSVSKIPCTDFKLPAFWAQDSSETCGCMLRTCMAIPFSHKGLQKLSLNAKIPRELWVKPRQREIRQKAAKATAECPVQSSVPLAVLCTTPCTVLALMVLTCLLTLQITHEQPKCDPMYPANWITVKITQLRQHRAHSVLPLWLRSCSEQMVVAVNSYIMLYMGHNSLLQAYLLQDG